MDAIASNPMARRPSTIERANQLARGGTCRTVEEITRQLKQEGQDSVDAHLGGSSIRRELRQICSQIRNQRVAQQEPQNPAE